MTTEEGTFVQPKPYSVELTPGDYFYCTCGLSKSQPFCDGSHRTEGTTFKPKKFTIDTKNTYYICGCKATENAPFCDGTHRKEKGIKKYNEFLLKQNTALKTRVEKLELGLKAGGAAVAIIAALGVALAAKIMH